MILDFIKRHEGLRLKTYKDTKGIWTVGYGHTGPNIVEGVVWTLEKAEAQLLVDVAQAQDHLARYLPFTQHLDPVRLNVLVDMTFNMGMAGVLKFKGMIAAITVQDWKKAAAEMLDSKWEKDVGARAHEDAKMMETGIASH